MQGRIWRCTSKVHSTKHQLPTTSSQWNKCLSTSCVRWRECTTDRCRCRLSSSPRIAQPQQQQPVPCLTGTQDQLPNRSVAPHLCRRLNLSRKTRRTNRNCSRDGPQRLSNFSTRVSRYSISLFVARPPPSYMFMHFQTVDVLELFHVLGLQYIQ